MGEKQKIHLAKLNSNQKGANNRYWKGGKIIDNFGYILVWCPYHPYANHLGYVKEHRLIMEKSIGRFLKKGEVVHHINEIVSDNRIENLKLMSLGEHTLYHNKKRKMEDGY